jgi:hypothetical protein
MGNTSARACSPEAWATYGLKFKAREPELRQTQGASGQAQGACGRGSAHIMDGLRRIGGQSHGAMDLGTTVGIGRLHWIPRP